MKPSASELVDLYQGHSTREIAALYGVGQPTVLRWMRRAGIQSRPYSQNKMPVAKGGTHSWGSQIAKANTGNLNVGQGNAGKTMDAAPNWRGGIRTDKDGRVFVYLGNGKYIKRAHKVWLDHHPGESIGSGYVIHHVDHDKTNDDPGNLVKMTISEHVRHHRATRIR